MAWTLIVSGLIAATVIVLVPKILARRTSGWAPRWSVRATRDLELMVSYEEAYARSLRAVTSLDLVGDPSIADGVIEAKVGANLKTSGNILTVQLRPDGRGRTAVAISGRPTLPQFYDWGRSRSMVDAIARKLMD